MKSFFAIALFCILSISILSSSVQALQQESQTVIGTVLSIDGNYTSIKLTAGNTILTYSKTPLSQDMLGKVITIVVTPVGDTFDIQEITSVSNT
jgi:hypothetical protein